jgi:hypothetical protein
LKPHGLCAQILVVLEYKGGAFNLQAKKRAKIPTKQHVTQVSRFAEQIVFLLPLFKIKRQKTTIVGARP